MPHRFESLMQPVNKTIHEMLNEEMHEGRNRSLIRKSFVALQRAYLSVLCTESMLQRKQVSNISMQMQQPLPTFSSESVDSDSKISQTQDLYFATNVKEMKNVKETKKKKIKSPKTKCDEEMHSNKMMKIGSNQHGLR